MWDELRIRPAIFDPAIMLDHSVWIDRPAGAAARFLPSPLVAMAMVGLGVALTREAAISALLIPPTDRRSSYLNPMVGSLPLRSAAHEQSGSSRPSSRYRTQAGPIFWAAPGVGTTRAADALRRYEYGTHVPSPVVGDSIEVVSGAVVIGETDVMVDGALPLRIARCHRSEQPVRGLLGPGWTSLFDARLDLITSSEELTEATSPTVRYLDGLGGATLFEPPEDPCGVVPREALGSGGWWAASGRWLVLLAASEVLSAGGVPVEIANDCDGYVVLDPVEGRSWLFATIAPAEGDSCDTVETDSVGTGTAAVLVGSGDQHGHWYAIDRDHAGAPVQVRTSGGSTILVQTTSVRDPSAPLGSSARIVGLHLLSDSDSDQGRGVQPLVRYGYDDEGLLAAVLDPHDRAMHYDYECVGPGARVCAWTDRNGSRYEYTYDDVGRCTRGHGPDGIRAVTVVYGDSATEGSRRLVTDSSGATREFGVNAVRQVVSVKDAFGSERMAQWDAFDRPVKLFDSAGRCTRFVWDEAGLLTQVEQPEGRIWAITWAATAKVATITTPDGSMTRYRYDGRGRCTEAVAVDGARWLFTYDRHSRLIGRTEPDGATHRWELDSAGLVVAQTQSLGADQEVTTQFERDAHGRLLRVQWPSSQVEYTRDAAGRLVQANGPDGAVRAWHWDPQGNLIEYVDPAGRATRMIYTVFDQLASVIAPDDTVTTYRYDLECRLIERIDSRGRCRCARDAEGQLVVAGDADDCRTVPQVGDSESVTRHEPSLRFRHDRWGRLAAANAMPAIGTESALTQAITGVESAREVMGNVFPVSYGWPDSEDPNPQEPSKLVVMLGRPGLGFVVR